MAYQSIGYVNGYSTSNASSSVILNVPSGVVDGNVMIAMVASNTGTIDPPPAGWIEDPPFSANCRVYRKVANSEPASYTFTCPAAASMCGFIDAYSGVDTMSLYDAPATAVQGTTLAVNWSSITTVTDHAWNVALSKTVHANDTVAPPSGYTARSAQGVTRFLRSSTLDISPVQAVAPSSTDTFGTPNWAAYSLVLRPALVAQNWAEVDDSPLPEQGFSLAQLQGVWV